jgi:hypothetical protein
VRITAIRPSLSDSIYPEAPGRFDLYKSRIDVPTIDDFLAKGFLIRTFSNGGLLFKCTDSRDRRCNNSLLPYFDSEVQKIRAVVRLGDYVNTAKIGLSEAYALPRSRTSSASSSMILPRSPYIAAQPGTYRPPIEEIGRGSGKDGSLYYPLVSRGTFSSTFRNIPHQDLQKVSAIEIKLQYE